MTLAHERAAWDQLLTAARDAHGRHPVLPGFCAFPDDLTAREVTPFDIPACGAMQQDPVLRSGAHADLCAGFIDCAPLARWRETYKSTSIGQDFMDRFGCYCLIGDGGPFHSDQMRAWVVYMPAGLWYPWHHHPSEEMYVILAGEGEFLRAGHPPETLREGQSVYHASNQPHAAQTHDQPFLAYVVWRNGFDTGPVLTPGAMLQDPGRGSEM